MYDYGEWRTAVIRVVTACSFSMFPKTFQNVITAQEDLEIAHEAADCREALEKVTTLKPAILLLSMDAPDIDSPAVSRMLRAASNPKTRGIAVISPNCENDALRAILLGCSGIVSADANAEVLVTCLRKVHGGEMWLDPLGTAMLMRQCLPSKTTRNINARSQAAPSNSPLNRTQKQIVTMMTTAIRRAQEAEDASLAKSRMLANMSHELRAPLNAIIGYSELMLNEIAGPVNDKQRSFLQDSLLCSSELRSVINSILDLAKLEAGKMEVSLERLDPVELIRTEVIDPLRSMAILKGLSVEVVGSVGDVITDSRKLKHIVENYVSNAIKYSPEQGTIVVRVFPQPNNTFSIEVIDQGPGIDPDDTRLLFNRFQQLSHAAKGTGLGLALAKELAELLGGKVGVESAPGKGSSFYVILPVNASVVPAPPSNQQCDSRPRILVVEDESSDRAFLRQILACEGYLVDSATHLRDAIKKCKSTRYDAITLDLVLGRDDGTALLKEVGLLNQLTPVIVVSSARPAPSSGRTQVYAQLRKPVEPNTLVRSLSSVGVFPKREHRLFAPRRQPVARALGASIRETANREEVVEC